jgi:hypothetical protein
VQDKAIKTYVAETKRFYAPTSRELAAHRQAVEDLENDDSRRRWIPMPSVINDHNMLVTLCRYSGATTREMLEKLAVAPGATIQSCTYACGLFADDPEFSPYVYDLITSYQAASRHRRQFTGQVLRALREKRSRQLRSMPRGTTQEQKTARESLLRQFGK